MAKKSAGRRDVFVNRHRGRLTTGAAGALVAESWNTGMNVGRSDPFKWVLLDFRVVPNYAAFTTITGTAPAAGFFTHWQLCIGTQTAMIPSDDMQLICDIGWTPIINTQGAASITWPLSAGLPGPIPIFAQTLTVMEDHFNSAALNGIEMGYELDYIAAPISQNEIVEYLSAFGQV